VLAPNTAIQRAPQRAFVYVGTADKTVNVHPIVVGSTTNDQPVISNGLAVGELVVTGGVNQLHVGSTVQVQTPEQRASA
jgi:multidrug efflux system membrane fusion protein